MADGAVCGEARLKWAVCFEHVQERDDEEIDTLLVRGWGGGDKM